MRNNSRQVVFLSYVFITSRCNIEKRFSFQHFNDNNNIFRTTICLSCRRVNFEKIIKHLHKRNTFISRQVKKKKEEFSIFLLSFFINLSFQVYLRLLSKPVYDVIMSIKLICRQIQYTSCYSSLEFI